ncbi:hypothetical protein ACFUJY_29475 [Streptomyces sp. NPDC057249]|uniref:hypothetical protein n=1 Tax=Streptomyces sp. NPDC057249 TaxID=3346067 RepID=UPI003641BC8F
MSVLTPMERRPAPVDNAAKFGGPHGAPVLWGGELAALLRDASFFSRPNTRTDKQAHVAVFSTGLNTRSEGSLGDLGAACDPGRIMLNDDLVLEAHEVGKPVRCRRRACQSLFAAAERQRSDLDHIRSYYRLEQRIGVRVGLGLRVRHAGRLGTIIDTSGQYLAVRLDGESAPWKVHATADMEYEGPDGWVRAVPLPDPYAAV